MITAVAQPALKSLELRTLIIGVIIVGIAVAVTTVSYLSNMTFVYQIKGESWRKLPGHTFRMITKVYAMLTIGNNEITAGLLTNYLHSTT